MRAKLTASLLISLLLGACAFRGEQPPSRNIPQGGPFKVHPGLLGKDSPAETFPSAPAPSSAVTRPQAEAVAESTKPIKLDPVGLRTQRSVYFDLASSDLKSDYEPGLRAHARYLAEHPKARVRIEGNADERGSDGYNRLLGQKRAETVRKTIIAHGAKQQQVAVKSLGKSRPKLAGHDEAAWAENRRADVVYEREN